MIDNEIKDIIESFCDEDVTLKFDKHPLFNPNNINIYIIDNKYGFSSHYVTTFGINDCINSYNKHIALDLFKTDLKETVKAAKRIFKRMEDEYIK